MKMLVQKPNTESPLEKIARQEQSQKAAIQAQREIAQQFDAAEIASAILAQKPMITKRLKARGACDADIEDAMSDLAVSVYAALKNYQKIPGRSFEAWVTGIAKNRLLDHYREAAKQAAMFTDFIDEITHHPATYIEDESETDYLTELVRKVRQQIVLEKDGISKWQKIVNTVNQPKRGRAARELLRRKMAEISGLPIEHFGTEPNIEKPAPKNVIEASVIAYQNGYTCYCPSCGIITKICEDVRQADKAAIAHKH